LFLKAADFFFEALGAKILVNNSFERPSYSVARGYAALIPTPSALFTSSIRAIRTAEANLKDGDINSLRGLAVSSTAFLVGISPTIKTVLYRAAEDLHSNSLPSPAELTPKKLAGLFDPRELTAILALAYITRHVKRRTDPKEWERFERKMFTHMEIGGIVGKTVRHIGSGNGILLGGIRFLTVMIFSMHDKKKFQEYRRTLDKSGKLFDLEMERTLFGCTHLEVAAALMQALGFGVVPTLGIMRDQGGEGLDDAAVDAEQLLCWHVARGLTESIHATGAAPSVDPSDDMYLPEEEASAIAKECWSVLRDGSKFAWFTASKNELPSEVCTALDITIKNRPTGGVEELEEGDESSV